MSLVYLCNQCGKLAKPRYGDQRDPGPFAPKEWSGLAGGKHLCDSCSSNLKEPETFGRVSFNADR